MNLAEQIIGGDLGAGGEPNGTLVDLRRIDCVPVANADGLRRWHA